MNIEQLYRVFSESEGVSIDTRTLQRNQIYFALKGERFDGHTYVQAALDQGASCAVIDDEKYVIDGQTILVDDALQVLQQLANHHRRQFSIPVIGITGSNGKTTTKELLATVLQQKYEVLATLGNLNNHIGVPLTLLNLNSQHEIAIIEMGANHLREIDFLCQLAEPNYGLITSIGRAHMGEFGSFEAIKQTKAELYQWLHQSAGQIFINLNLEELVEMNNQIGCKKNITYSAQMDAQYRYQYLGSNPYVKFAFNQQEVQTQLVGEYNFNNLIAAATVGQYFDISQEQIRQALQDYIPTNNRSQIVSIDTNTLILDAYNANPSSMESALTNLQKMESVHKGAVLGEMLELGEYSQQEHQQIADLAQSMSLDFILLVGEEFADVEVDAAVLKFPDVHQAKDWWQKQNFEQYLILIKGSRGVQLEKLLQ